MRTFLRIISAIGDYLLLVVSLGIVLAIRTEKANLNFIIFEYLKIFSWMFIIWILLFALFDLYNFDIPPRFPRFIFCLLICILLATVLFYTFPRLAYISPKTNLALLGVVFSLFYYLWRKIVDLIFVNILHGHEIMFTVSDSDSFELACMIQENPRYKYKINGILCTEAFQEKLLEHFDSKIIFTDSIAFEDAIIDSRIQTIVSTSTWFTRLYGTMYDLLPRNIRIINMINFYERLLGYIPVHSTSQFWIMTNFDLVSTRAYLIVKRLFDIFFAIIISPITLVIILVTAIVIKITYGKNYQVFFSQKRVGRFNHEFVLYKFRTMIMDAEKAGAVWAEKNDPRVTKIGKRLRLTRIDELPQIWNILKGDMSFIGPRPERREFVEQLEQKIPHYRLRHVIKPGLSGWAQTKFRYGSSIKDATIKLCYDLYYIKNMNFLLDTRIFFKTIQTVFTAKGQ